MRSRSSKDAEDFDLLIWQEPAGYRARVQEPDSGREVLVSFACPFSPGDLEALAARMRCRDLLSSLAEPPEEALAAGISLFRVVFAGELLVAWLWRLREAERKGRAVRLRLRLADPELWDWPWELLHDPLRGFLAASPRIFVLRYVEIPEPIEPLRVRPPIRVLAVAASPAGLRPVSADEELADLDGSLRELQEAERIELDLLRGATRDGLRRKLAEKSFHVLHFIGHGAFDPVRGGAVLLEGKEGGEDRLDGEALTLLLQAHPELRLVVLNICQGARGDRSDPFSGLAKSLIRGRVPAVVAMRSTVSDQGAVLFSHHFYASLSRRDPVDRAITQARHAMLTEKSVDWGIPVLAMRSPDGRLFGLFWWEILWDRTVRFLRTWRRWLVTLLVLILLAESLGQSARRVIDPNLPWALLNPAECPSPPGLAIAFVRIDPPPPLRPFCLGRFEVTQSLWTKVTGLRRRGRQRGNSLPMLLAFQLTPHFFASLEQRAPGGGFRLPTRAEWMYAATADGQASSLNANCDNADEDDGFAGLAPVGSFARSPLGLYDMLGNAAEWVSDTSDTQAGRALRVGGSFRNVPKNCSVTFTSWMKRDSGADATGFRVVRVPRSL